MWTLMTFYFDVSILLCTPAMLATSAEDKIFSMENPLICNNVGKISISPIWMKYRCTPFVRINNPPSTL